MLVREIRGAPGLRWSETAWSLDSRASRGGAGGPRGGGRGQDPAVTLWPIPMGGGGGGRRQRRGFEGRRNRVVLPLECRCRWLVAHRIKITAHGY